MVCFQTIFRLQAGSYTPTKPEQAPGIGSIENEYGSA
jgi:hypothetical protein